MAGRAMHEARAWLSRLSARLRPLEDGPVAVLLLDGDPALAFRLDGPGPWTVGRGARADVRLDQDRTVSRQHVRIRRHGAAFTAEAARGTTNAAWLGTTPLPPGVPVLLAPGAVLVAGRTRLAFHLAD